MITDYAKLVANGNGNRKQHSIVGAKNELQPVSAGATKWSRGQGYMPSN